MNGEERQVAKEQLNSWVTKGGGGAIAAMLFFFGQNFVDKQDQIIADLAQLRTEISNSESDRDRIETRVETVRHELVTSISRANADLSELTSDNKEQWETIRKIEQTLVKKGDLKAPTHGY